MLKTIHYSKVRRTGARHTACTKLNQEDRDALHYMALERGISDYELTRRILIDFIRGDTKAAHKEVPPPKLPALDRLSVPGMDLLEKLPEDTARCQG